MIPIQAEICLKFRLIFHGHFSLAPSKTSGCCGGTCGALPCRSTVLRPMEQALLYGPSASGARPRRPFRGPRPALAEGIHKLFTHPSKFVQSFPPGVWYPMSVDRITKAFFIISNLLSFSTQKNAPLEGGAFFHIFLSPSSLKRSLMRSLCLSMGGRPRHSHPMGMPGPSFFWWGAQPGGQVMSRPASTWKCRWWTDWPACSSPCGMPHGGPLFSHLRAD